MLGSQVAELVRRYPLVWVIGSVRLGHWKWCSTNTGSNPVPDYRYITFKN